MSTIDAFRQMLENYEPLWVVAAIPGLHAIVVTGIYSDGAPDGPNTYIRIADSWDRVTGTPVSVGSYLNTHTTGSRYILRWADFVREYETAATDYQRVNIQILHSLDTGGKTPNYGKPTAYAMGSSWIKQKKL